MIWAIFAILIAALTSVTSAMALAFGLFLSLVFKARSPSAEVHKKLLQLSVIGLGAGIQIDTVITVGLRYFGVTLLGIAFALVLGHYLTRLFDQPKDTGTLISVGSAICGGSAIAATAPTIQAKPEAIAVSLATIFTLNSIALWIFPILGQFFQLTPEQFGVWSALAIHDTSSVVGATVAFHPDSVGIGTTVKLSRALWIIPMTLMFQYLEQRKTNSIRKRLNIPYFILGFVGFSILFSFVEFLEPYKESVNFISKKMLIATLFLIGLGFNRKKLKETSPKAFAIAVILWASISSFSLLGVLKFMK